MITWQPCEGSKLNHHLLSSLRVQVFPGPFPLRLRAGITQLRKTRQSLAPCFPSFKIDTCHYQSLQIASHLGPSSNLVWYKKHHRCDNCISTYWCTYSNGTLHWLNQNKCWHIETQGLRARFEPIVSSLMLDRCYNHLSPQSCVDFPSIICLLSHPSIIHGWMDGRMDGWMDG